MIHSSTGGDIKSTTSKVSIAWPPNVTGTGATLIGTIVEVRNHSVQDNSGKHHRRNIGDFISNSKMLLLF